MDPAELLDAAAALISENDLDAARELLDAYREWRARGGFEPPGGDAKVAKLQRRLAKSVDDRIFAAFARGVKSRKSTTRRKRPSTRGTAAILEAAYIGAAPLDIKPGFQSAVDQGLLTASGKLTDKGRKRVMRNKEGSFEVQFRLPGGESWTGHRIEVTRAAADEEARRIRQHGMYEARVVDRLTSKTPRTRRSSTRKPRAPHGTYHTPTVRTPTVADTRAAIARVPLGTAPEAFKRMYEALEAKLGRSPTDLEVRAEADRTSHGRKTHKPRSGWTLHPTEMGSPHGERHTKRGVRGGKKGTYVVHMKNYQYAIYWNPDGGRVEPIAENLPTVDAAKRLATARARAPRAALKYRAIKWLKSSDDTHPVGKWHSTRAAALRDAYSDYAPHRRATYEIENSNGKRTELTDRQFQTAEEWYHKGTPR